MADKERGAYLQSQDFRARHDDLKRWKADYTKEREAAALVHQASEDPETATMMVDDFLGALAPTKEDQDASEERGRG